MKAKKTSKSGSAAIKPLPRAASDAEIIALFKQFAAQSRSAASHLEANLAQIERLGAAARDDAGMRRGREYADEIDLYLGRVRGACQEDNSVDAALNALKLAEIWIELRWLRSEVPRERRRAKAKRKAAKRT